jgi:hypothetical protein
MSGTKAASHKVAKADLLRVSGIANKKQNTGTKIRGQFT